MTRMTIATDPNGNVIGAFQKPNGREANGVESSVTFAPGTRLHEIEVSSELDISKVRDVDAFHEALQKHVGKLEREAAH